jgi:uncharacterized protein DUF4388
MVPSPDPMSLSGKLETMGLSEVLQWIATSRKTGTLYLRRASVEKRIVFQAGEIYSSWSNHPRESLGQFLIRDRLITEEQLFRALLRQEQLGKMLGGILVDDEAITPGQLKRALQTKAEETVYDLFEWPDGEFQFREGEFAEVFHIELPVTHVVLEGIRRVDEWQRFRDAFPDAHCTFAVAPGAASAEAAETHALQLAAAGRTLPEIALEMRRSEFDAASILLALHERGLVAVGGVQPQEAAEDPVAAIQELLGRAGQQMTARRFKDAWEAYEEVLRLDRLNQHAKKGVRAALQALVQERATRDIPLHKVPVLVLDMAALTRETLDPQEAFVLSRVNGTWDVRSILKICPLGEPDALQIFARLVERNLIELR